jgi:LAO/AO transport system kinase
MRQLRAMLRLGGPPREGWEPPILPAVAMRDEGIAQIAAGVERHLAHLNATGQKAERERARAAREFQLIVQEAALERMRAHLAEAGWDTLVAKIAAREIDPYTAAAALLG